MLNTNDEINSWRDATKIEDMISLIDRGILLPWQDSRKVLKGMAPESMEIVIRHIAKLFDERSDQLLSMEILTESLLAFISAAGEKKLIYQFIAEIFSQVHQERCIDGLIKTVLKNDLIDKDYREGAFVLGIFLISELGLAIFQYKEETQDNAPWIDTCLHSIATHLLALGNENNTHIRLALLRYFGTFNVFPQYRFSFNRILSRFAHTLLEQLFSQLFNRKNEASALSYLLEVMPYIFEGDQYAQQIVYYNFRHFLLKYPDRFVMFLTEIAKKYEELPQERSDLSLDTYLKHLVALFDVCNEVDHKNLGRDVLMVIINFSENNDVKLKAYNLFKQLSLRKSFLEMGSLLVPSLKHDEILKTLSKQSTKKRGRKPSFSKNSENISLTNMDNLGIEISKAS